MARPWVVSLVPWTISREVNLNQFVICPFLQMRRWPPRSWHYLFRSRGRYGERVIFVSESERCPCDLAATSHKDCGVRCHQVATRVVGSLVLTVWKPQFFRTIHQIIRARGSSKSPSQNTGGGWAIRWFTATVRFPEFTHLVFGIQSFIWLFGYITVVVPFISSQFWRSSPLLYKCHITGSQPPSLICFSLVLGVFGSNIPRRTQ